MKYATLEELCKIQSGGTPSRSRTEYWSSRDIPWVKISDMKGKYIQEIEEYISQKGLDNSSAKIFPEGTILYTIFATLGEVGILGIDAATNQAIAGLTVTNDSVQRDYLYYYLQSIKKNVAHMGRGVAQNNINMGILKKLEVPLYSKEEQVKIVERLVCIEELISNRQQALSILDNLIKSRFVEMFGDPVTNPMGWEIQTIGDSIVDSPQNGMYKPQSAYVSDNSGTPILRIDAFYDGVVTSFSNLKRLNCEPNEIEKYLLKEDDIVINRVNSLEYLGKCAHIYGLLENTVYESNMMRFHLDDRFSPVYVTFLLCSRYLKNQIMSKAKKAVNQASINQQDVCSLIINCPPIALQNQFAAFVQQTEKSKAAVQQSIDTLQTLKASLMQEYFG